MSFGASFGWGMNESGSIERFYKRAVAWRASFLNEVERRVSSTGRRWGSERVYDVAWQVDLLSGSGCLIGNFGKMKINL